MGVLVIPVDDEDVRHAAAGHGLEVLVHSGWPALEGPTLWAAEGVTIPWALVDAGFRFVERWDAAAPLWRYGVLAQDVGNAAERERTRVVMRDLRVPLYAPELLFLQASAPARALLDCWREELVGSTEPRLAFVRALCRVKPRFLALPRDWLEEMAPAPRVSRTVGYRSRQKIRVQVAPGLYTQCLPEHAEMYRERYRAKKRGG